MSAKRKRSAADGKPHSLADLPPPDTVRWVITRKAKLVAAIEQGLLSAETACQRYNIAPEELELWQRSISRAGLKGLRVTKLQTYGIYRETFECPASVERTEQSYR